MALRDLGFNCLRTTFNAARLSLLMAYTAIHWLVTRLLYLLHLLSMSRFCPQIRRVPSLQSLNLRRYHKERQELLNAWEQVDKSAVLFVALDVAFMGETQKTVTAIGLSHWCLDRTSELISFHWIIDDLQGLGIRKAAFEDDLFLYGTTEGIRESDIGPSLHDTFSDLSSRYQQIYLIGHNVEFMLDRLSTHWVVPNNCIVLDILFVWQAPHNITSPVSLEDCINSIPKLQDSKSSLNNVGNSSRVMIWLLQNQEVEWKSARIGLTQAPLNW
ncbi:hypothetical protein F4782DRAFT_514691 [Xylaria castorea]|nr:hypothetical protein F4782DRAFT_514691 [Xylaria castorea]